MTAASLILSLFSSLVAASSFLSSLPSLTFVPATFSGSLVSPSSFIPSLGITSSSSAMSAATLELSGFPSFTLPFPLVPTPSSSAITAAFFELSRFSACSGS